MQPIITKEHIDSVGITLDDQASAVLLTHLNDTLQERVGAEITESLDDEQLQQLLDIREKGDDQATAVWLQANVPELQTIIQDEIDILLGEVTNDADNITANK